MHEEWQKTICILCSVNCGIEVKVEGRHLTRVHGNREHVASQGYACEKAQRIDYYQNGRDRLTSPLRRRFKMVTLSSRTSCYGLARTWSRSTSKRR